MFVSHDIKSNKRKFQKPNILRRKPALNKSLIVHTLDKNNTYESQDLKTLLPSNFVVDPKSNELKEQKFRNTADQVYSVGKSISKTDNVTLGLSSTQNVVRNISAHNSLIYIEPIQQNNNEFSQNQTLNVQPFLVGDVINQNDPGFDRKNKETEIQAKQKWCINLIQDPDTIIIKHIDDTQPGCIGYLEQKPEKPLLSSPKPLVQQESAILQGDPLASANNTQTLSIEQLIRITNKFKCDIPNCDKEFTSKQKLNKHVVSVHNKDKNVKPQRQITVECPVKRVLEGGAEELCGKIFHAREGLMKHLNEEHTIDEALYSCAQCGRRFFWASGLRAHARAHLARAELACPWPGCGRVFRQPCRLREHSRAHTGDRPYPCLFPECGWSFRTASKLVRHARRHTGERRHACAACGRAFLRREHLRDHAQRHAAPQRRAKHACPAADCQQSFTNMSSLYMHMKKVHKKEDSEVPAGETLTTPHTDDHEVARVKADNMFMVSLLEPGETTEIDQTAGVTDTIEETLGEELGEAGELEEVGEVEDVGEVEEVGETEEVEEGHSARTHCTWPLPRALNYQPSAYVLEEDIQVEQAEGSESNIYTVRSDLFLHGNMLHNEDSEQMAACARVSAGGGAGAAADGAALALDADLLLDAPSVHLDQEELYTDAVDEASFRVFLLSGEELV